MLEAPQSRCSGRSDCEECFPPPSCAPPRAVGQRRFVVFANESGASLSWHAAAVEGSLLGSFDAVARSGQIAVDSWRWPSLGCDGNVELVVARLKPLGGRGGAHGRFHCRTMLTRPTLDGKRNRGVTLWLCSAMTDPWLVSSAII